MKYSSREVIKPQRRKWPFVLILLALVVAGAAAAYFFLKPSPEEKTVNHLQFDASITEAEKQQVNEAITEQNIELKADLTVKANTVTSVEDQDKILNAYVPVTGLYSPKQTITTDELKSSQLAVGSSVDQAVAQEISKTLDLEGGLSPAESELGYDSSEIRFIPASELSYEVKLLAFDGSYYLDEFTGGAVFRTAEFSGEGASGLDLAVNILDTADDIFKANLTGVTALTRLMQRKLSSVGDPLHFSAKIGDFLSDADLTHVSNEVSFREGCQYHVALFCSPPEFIETLKDSGVDLVELTGNHNNDNGSSYNTQSIELYHSLGMATFGGGINAEEAAKPYVSDKKGSKITFLGYNMADGAGSGAIARGESAGANLFTEEKAAADIAAAKQNSQFVIVHIQYAECQAYPSGYVEYPICDAPIPGQQEDFRHMIDLGADMVVGSSAHQPQTYEIYNGKPIYYGLGNMYFEQVQWPGTERGIILTHYFSGGKLLQTKLTPTVYDREFQTRVMETQDAEYLLGRLNQAR